MVKGNDVLSKYSYVLVKERCTSMGGIAIGQAGGPTAVINMSVAGFLEHIPTSRPVYAVLNGYEGLVQDNMFPLQGELSSKVLQRRNLPGAIFGAGRYHLDEEKIQIALKNLIKKEITTLVFIGGNGTMAALNRISEMAAKVCFPLQTIGIPKTVDNDLAETDHAPGFGSAAKYVAYATRDISLDLKSMSNFEQVRVIETMGRNAGWLALSAGYLKKNEHEGPHLIYVPEQPIYAEKFIQDVRNTVKEYGTATIVVSEGAQVFGQNQVEQAEINGRKVLGGISHELKEMVTEQLGYFSRTENLGMSQRCFSLAVSQQDRQEAYEFGKRAAEGMLSGKTNVMVNVIRKSETPYRFEYSTVSLEKVASKGERMLPKEFLENPREFYEWLSPLISNKDDKANLYSSILL